MKYLSKKNITVIATFSILFLIMVSLVLCNSSVAHYKTRITVDTVDFEITPYQPVNTVVEEPSDDEINAGEEQGNLEESNSLE